jgi:HlyD family secretion protein
MSMDESQYRLMRQTFSPKVIIALAVVIVLGSSFIAWKIYSKQQASLYLPGEVQAQELRSASRLGGRVLKVWVHEGQSVKSGQRLVDFDDTDLLSKIAAAEADLKGAQLQERQLAKGADIDSIRQANASVTQAQQQVRLVDEGLRPQEIAQSKERFEAAMQQAKQAKDSALNAKNLLDNGIISQQKYETIQQSLAVAQANADSAKSAYTMAQSGGRPEERSIARSRLVAAKAQAQQVAKGASSEQIAIASASVDKAKSQLTALKAQLKEAHISASFSGYVSVVAVSPGELIAPGRPVVNLIDIEHLWTDVFVPESRLLKMHISPGEKVSVIPRADKSQTFAGKVLFVNPKSEFSPGGESNTDEPNFRVKLEIQNTIINGKQLLYPGMKVDVHFQ